MNDNLQYKPRKELKQLCSQFNIRTAGVKHDELVQLLRRKLHPPKSEVPRSPNARPRKSAKVSDMQSPAMENGAADNAPKRSASHGRTLQTLLHENDSEQEASPAPKRKVIQAEPGLPERTPLTKSNTIGTRRTDFLRKKAIGVPGIENSYATEASLKKPKAVRTPKGIDNLSNSVEASEHLESTVSVASTSEDVGVDDLQAGQASADTQSEAITDTQGSEADASSTIVEPSDPGSDDLRGLSDIVADAGPDIISEVSEADEFHDASSKILRYSSLGSNFSLRTATSGMSLFSVPSGFSLHSEGTGGSVDNTSQLDPEKVNCGLNSEYLDQYLSSTRAAEGEGDELIEAPIPYIVIRLDALDGSMDEVQSSNSDVDTTDRGGVGVGEDKQVSKMHADPYQAAMAQDYVNYTRGTETGRLVEETAGSTVDDKEEKLAEHVNPDAGTSSSAGREGCGENMPVGSPSTQEVKFEDFLHNEDVFHGVNNGSSDYGGIFGSEDGDMAVEGVWHHGYIPEHEAAAEKRFSGAASEDRGHVESTSETASTSQGARDSKDLDNPARENPHIMGDRCVIADDTNAGEGTSSTVIKLEASSAGNAQDEVDGEECASAPVAVEFGKSEAGVEGEIDERGVEVRSFEDGEPAEPVSRNAEDAVKELEASAPELEDIILSGPTSSIVEEYTGVDESTPVSASEKNIGYVGNTPPVQGTAVCGDITIEEGVNEDQPGPGKFEGGDAAAPVLEKVDNPLKNLDASAPGPEVVNISGAPFSVAEEHGGDEGSVAESALPSLDSAKFRGLDHVEEQTTRTGTSEISVPLPENVEDALEELDASAPELERLNRLKPVPSSVAETRGGCESSILFAPAVEDLKELDILAVSTPEEDICAVCAREHVGDASEEGNAASTEMDHVDVTETPVSVSHGDEDVEDNSSPSFAPPAHDSTLSREVSSDDKGLCDLETDIGTSGLSSEKWEETSVEQGSPGQDDASVASEAQNICSEGTEYPPLEQDFVKQVKSEDVVGDQDVSDIETSNREEGIASSPTLENGKDSSGELVSISSELEEVVDVSHTPSSTSKEDANNTHVSNLPRETPVKSRNLADKEDEEVSTPPELEPSREQQGLDVELSGVLSLEVMKNGRSENGHAAKGTKEIAVREWVNPEKNLQNGHSTGFGDIGAAADGSTPLSGEDKRPQPSKISSNLQNARFKERSSGPYSMSSANSVSSMAVEARDLAPGDSLDDLVTGEESQDADVENSEKIGEYEVSVVQDAPLEEPDIGGREDFLSSTISKPEDMGTPADDVSVEASWQPTNSLEEFVHESREEPKATFVSEWASSSLPTSVPVTSLKVISKDELSEESRQSFAFPVSVVLWCSQSCSSLFGQSNSGR